MRYYVVSADYGTNTFYVGTYITVRSTVSLADAAERLVSLISHCKGNFKSIFVSEFDEDEHGITKCNYCHSCPWERLVQYAHGKPLE